jgi:hypothetical protein
MQLNIKFPAYQKQSLSNLIPNASSQAVLLMEKMLKVENNTRITTQELLKDLFFNEFKLGNDIQIGQEKQQNTKEQIPF